MIVAGAQHALPTPDVIAAVGLAVQTPIGAAIDETRAKRGIVVLAPAVLAITATVIFVWPTFWPVAVSNSLMAIAGDVFGPAVAALTLGLYARAQLARRMGRNSAFDHGGNVAPRRRADGRHEKDSAKAPYNILHLCNGEGRIRCRKRRLID
jgi:hypothetical protein